MVIANHATVLDGAVIGRQLTHRHHWWRRGVRTLRPSSRLVVGRRGSTGLIGVVVSQGVERFRFAAAAIPDRFGRWGFACVVVAGFVGLIGVIVPHGVERFRFAAAAIPDRLGSRGFACVVVVGFGFGFIGWAEESFGAVVVVDPGLAGVQLWGWCPFDFAAGVDGGGPAASPTMRLSGPQARPSSSTLVLPPSTQSATTWWTWPP